jgi:outer membrane lipoprotein-sorting protein
MSALTSRPALRWALPAAVLVAVVAAGGAGKVLIGDTTGALPSRSPQQLLMDVAQAKVDTLSGTIVQKSSLGLPALPNVGAGSADLSSLVSGNHTLRVWYDTPNHVRVSLLGTNGESDVIRNNQDVWLWNSEQKSATHTTLTGDQAKAQAGRDGKVPSGLVPSGASGSPLATDLNGATSQLLSTLGTSTDISTNGTAKVAGRNAYELVLTPKDSASRVRDIRIAIDGERHIPTRIQVYARGAQAPAFEAAFTSISFGKPSSAEFSFKPPAGTKVTEGDKNDKHGTEHPDSRTPDSAEPQTQVVGTGWTTVFAAKGVQTSSGDAQADKQFTAFLNSLPKVSGSWGSGHLLQSKLFSALLTDDGRVFVGAVDPNKLYAAADQVK